MVERAAPENVGGKDDPICPICLEPIKSKDRVAGVRDDLMHEACDHARQRATPRPPKPRGVPDTR